MTGERCAPGRRPDRAALERPALERLHARAQRSPRGRLDERPPALGGASAGEALLAPTVIYVRAVLALLRSGADVAGLAHITGDGLLNLKRLSDGVGFEIDAPLPVPGVCAWLCELGAIDAAAGLPRLQHGLRLRRRRAGRRTAAPAVALLAEHHPGAAPIGRVSDRAGAVTLPGLGVTL